MNFYIGLDVHSKHTTFCIQDAHGQPVATGEFETTAASFRDFVRQYELPEGTIVALETGTVAFFVSRQLSMLGLCPHVIDAHEVRRTARRRGQKSDTRDAEELCHGIRTGMYRSIVHVPPKTVRLIRETLKRRRHFVRTAASQVVAIKSLLRASGLRQRASSLRTPEAWAELVERLQPLHPELAQFADCHRIMWRTAQSQASKLEGQLQKLANPFQKALSRLQQIPGVGPVVSITVLAALSDAKRFKSAKHVASYAGLVPSTSQSGDRDHHGHITKAGNSELRSMLIEAAHHASRARHPLNPMFTKICAKSGYKIAVTAVAHKLLRIMWAMLKHEKDFDLQRLGIEEGPFQTVKTKHFRLRARAK